MRDASDDPDEQQLCDALGSSTVMYTGGIIQESVRRGTRPRELAWGIDLGNTPVVQIVCTQQYRRWSSTAVIPVTDRPGETR